MIFEQEILGAWASSDDLEALLPAVHVRTGRSSGGTLPYAAIIREDSHPVGHTNTGDALDQTTLRIDVWHDDYLEGLEIAKQIKRYFDRCWLERSDTMEVFRMRRMKDSIEQDADGIWQFGTAFLAELFPGDR